MKKVDEWTRVRRTLGQLDIPSDAMIVEVTGRIVPDVGVTALGVEPLVFRSNHTLRDKRRPLEGGLQIVRAGGGTCTLGFLARWGSPLQTVFVTDSHCSSNMMHPDNSAFYQHAVGGAAVNGLGMR